MQADRARRRARRASFPVFLVPIALLLLASPGPAGAVVAADADDGEAVDVQDLKREIAEQQRAIQAQLHQIDSQRRTLEQQREVLGRQQKALERLQAGVSAASEEDPDPQGPALPSVAQGPSPRAPVAPRPAPPREPAEPSADTTPAGEAGTATEEGEAKTEEGEAKTEEGEAKTEEGEATTGEGAQAATGQGEAGGEAQGAIDTGEATVRPNAREPIDQLLVEAGAVLLPQGVLQIEPSSEYTHSEVNNINISGFTVFEAIIIGTLRVDRIEADTFNSVLNMRMGLFDRLQLEARLPYPYRRERRTFGVGTNDRQTLDTDNWKFGDLDVGMLYQPPIRGIGWVPNVVLNWRARFPTGEDPFGIPLQTVTVNQAARGTPERPATGNGFYGLSQGFTLQWRTDPVVFFMGSNYTINFKDVKGRFGKINPGNTLDSFFGLNVALSNRVGLNFSFSDSYTFETRVNSQKQNGSAFNDARLLIGTSIGLNRRTNLILAAAAGLTDTSPDFQFTVRLPMTFHLPIELPDVPFLD